MLFQRPETMERVHRGHQSLSSCTMTAAKKSQKTFIMHSIGISIQSNWDLQRSLKSGQVAKGSETHG